MMKTAVCALAIAIACASAVPAGAQGSYGSSGGSKAELTLFNGYYIASDLYTSIVDGASAQIGLENSYMWGAKLGLNPNERVGLEFAYTRAGSNLTYTNSISGLDPDTELGRLDLNSYDLNFLFYQDTPNPRAKGFFVLGFGWTQTSPDIKPELGKTIDSNSLFNWNFGLGAKVDLTEKLALRLEGRWRVTDTAVTTSAGVYCDYWGYCYSYSSDWYDSGELTAGLTYKIPSR
jgi:opacity protein-like surface antigen